LKHSVGPKDSSDHIRHNNNIMYSTMRAYNIKKMKKSSSCKSNSTSQQTEEVNIDCTAESKELITGLSTPGCQPEFS
jgi:hypothetical protein